ncbi:BON domain-containing protein [Paraburkholderia sp. A1RO-5L]|uniref:BON domain-containing protein n=1 Tax=unclassified Paraburkholderia TaxID=2615204 RepID=UPI003B984F38
MAAGAFAQSGSGAARPEVPPPHGLVAGSSSVGSETNDAIITARARAALLGTADLDSNDVHITTNRGVVTLTGTVSDDAQKNRAAQSIQELDGVHLGHERATCRRDLALTD